MRITTNIRKSDLIRFNLAIMPRLRSTYITIGVITILTFIFICWKSGVPETGNDFLIVLFSSLAGGFIGMLFGYVFSMISVVFMSSSNSGILGEHEYTLSPKGLYEKTLANEGLSKWEGISSVKVAGPYLMFQISGYLFHIVAARSFDSIDDFNEYVDVAIGYWKNRGRE